VSLLRTAVSVARKSGRAPHCRVHVWRPQQCSASLAALCRRTLSLCSRIRSYVMLKDTVDGEFTTVEDVAEAAVFFAGFSSNALTGQ
jgi:hypothetical protein